MIALYDEPPGHCVPPGGVRTGEDLAAQHLIHRQFPAGCAALVRGAPAGVEDAGADHLRRRAAAGGGQHHLQYHHHHRRVVGVVLRGGGGAAVPDRHPQAGIFPQRAHRRRRDPGARLGTAAGHAGDGGGVRPAGAGGRAGVLRLCEAGTGGSTLDLTPRTCRICFGEPGAASWRHVRDDWGIRRGRGCVVLAWHCRGRSVSPIGLRTWVWILAGLFVVCTLPLMVIALVQGTMRYAAAEDNLVSLRQLRQTFDLANLVSSERGPANSLLGARADDSTEQARLAMQLAVVRRQVDAAMLQLDTAFKAHPGEVDAHAMLADAQRRRKAARACVDRGAAQPQDARRVEDVERAISSMFAVVDRLHLLMSAQINVLVRADREAAIPAMQGQVLIDLREHGGRLASNVMAPVAVPGAWRNEQVRAALQTEGRLLELWRLAGSHEAVFRSDPALSWHWDMARRQFFGESLPMVEQLIEDGRRGVPPPWTAAEFTRRYVPTLQSLEALRDGYLSVAIARFEHTRNRAAMRLAVLVATVVGTLVVLGVALRIAHVQILRPLLQAQRQVIQIASDAPGPEQHVTHPLAEMQRLFDAIEVDNADPAALRHWQQLLGQLGGGASELPDWSPAEYQPWTLLQREHLNPGSPGGPVYWLRLQPPAGAAVQWQAGDIAGTADEGCEW
ncbi:hypothetical protein G6F31_012513 [Rhizopus arrhizus]|nr:hypothetical protein G6F31_012513 [Rhizopus arrhizus]